MFRTPPLQHDRMMFERFGHVVGPIGKAERKTIAHLLNYLSLKGFKVCFVDDCGPDDELQAVGTIKEAMEVIFSVDEAHIYLTHESDSKRRYWLAVVLGNGHECIADWNVPEEDITGWTDAMDAFDFDKFER